MTLIRTAASSALLVALVGGTMATGPASAAVEPAVFGTYSFEAKDGESATWSVAPCPENTDGCIRVAEFGNSKRKPWSGEAHYVVGSWVLLADQPDAVLCEDGTSVPGRNTYTWDSATLAGSVSTYSPGACGLKSGSVSIPFTLAKTGAGAAPNPTAPAPQAPAEAVAPTPSPVVPLPAAPLPAEAPPS
jgi:hypothetical protein